MKYQFNSCLLFKRCDDKTESHLNSNWNGQPSLHTMILIIQVIVTRKCVGFARRHGSSQMETIRLPATCQRKSNIKGVRNRHVSQAVYNVHCRRRRSLLGPNCPTNNTVRALLINSPINQPLCTVTVCFVIDILNATPYSIYKQNGTCEVLSNELLHYIVT